MKICFVVSSLEAGGAERVISLLANGWAASGQDVSVVTTGAAATDSYPLDSAVTRLALKVERDSHSTTEALKLNLRKVRSLRRAIKSLAPHVVISFIDRVNVLTLLACFNLQIPVIVSERVHPDYHYIGASWSFLRRLLYPLADALVMQSKSATGWAKRVVRHNRIHVIPNPVGAQFSEWKDQKGGSESGVILAVGRLVRQKAFDVLIKAFSIVAALYPGWTLTILGTGPEENALRQLAHEVLPEGVVKFMGMVRDPEQYYRSADIVVVPSRFEGLPNALLEGMASGCAVIASDCPGGTGEVVTHAVNGLLVRPDDVTGLASAMQSLMSNPPERVRLGSRASEVSTEFRLNRVLQLWVRVIRQVGALVDDADRVRP